MTFVTERQLFPTLLWSSFYSFILALLSYPFLILTQWLSFILCLLFCLLILDGAFRLSVWITRQYFPLICYSFNCQQILLIYSLPPENICFCLLYSKSDWTRLDPFFRVSVRTLIPSTHSRLFESCSSFYFPLP
jgi:hypothetical protein